jgi:hypothetical protein
MRPWPINDGLVGQLNNQSRSQGLIGSAAAYWPSNGSLSSDPCLPVTTNAHVQAESNYRSLPNFAPHRTQDSHQLYSTERNHPTTPSVSSERMAARHELNRNPQGSSSGDDEGLSMMTSALLTMMDRQDQPSDFDDATYQQRYSVNSLGSLGINQDEELYSSRNGGSRRPEGATPLRAPPGMMMMSPPPDSSHFRQDVARPKSPLGGGYFIGGYDQPPPR